MATHDDYHGVYFTIQALRLYQELKDIPHEFVVVDNNPGKPHGVATNGFLNSIGGRYVPMIEPVGTTAPRERVFKEAKGKYTIVMDPHVLPVPKSIKTVLGMWEKGALPETALVSGPILMDNLNALSTHFNDVWRSEMRGVWGSTWCCPCRKPTDKYNRFLFTVEKKDPNIEEQNQPIGFYALSGTMVPVTTCPYCNKRLPIGIQYPGHQQHLSEAGYLPVGTHPDHEPFDVPGQGLGLFAAKTDKWLGFNPHFTAFGGEEMYIHDKYRMAGARCICVPALAWVHRFANPDGRKHPLTRYNKMRNYVLGALELGQSLDPIREHFVRPGGTPQAHWDYLLENPITNVEPPKTEEKGTGMELPPKNITDPKGIYGWYVTSKITRDLDQHLPKLVELGMKCARITEFAKRRESTMAFAATDAKIVSYQMEKDPLLDLYEKNPKIDIQYVNHEFLKKIDRISETDLLFIDFIHTYDAVSYQLKKFHTSVSRYIVLHDTALHGTVGEDGKPGIMHAVKELLTEVPHWSVVYATQDQYGLVVLSRNPEDKPALPGIIEMSTNFAKALATHVASGAGKATEEVYKKRLETCTLCDLRNGDRCSACGCGLAAKASWETSQCPIGKW